MKLAGHGALAQVRTVYFLYWYKTNTDALLRQSLLPVLTGAGLRAHLTFVPSKASKLSNMYISLLPQLTSLPLYRVRPDDSVYLLYWYESTRTDT